MMMTPASVFGNSLLTFDMFADHAVRPIGTLMVASVGKFLIHNQFKYLMISNHTLYKNWDSLNYVKP